MIITFSGFITVTVLFDVNFYLTFFGYTSLFLGISIFLISANWDIKTIVVPTKQLQGQVPVPIEATIAFDDDAPA